MKIHVKTKRFIDYILSRFRVGLPEASAAAALSHQRVRRVLRGRGVVVQRPRLPAVLAPLVFSNYLKKIQVADVVKNQLPKKQP